MISLLGVDLTDRLVLVVGGGPAAARRTLAMLACGASVRVVAPELCEDLAELARAGDITWRADDVRPADLMGTWLVHSMSGDREADARVRAWADERHLWCVVGDDEAIGTARKPAVTRHGDVVVGVVSVDGPDALRSSVVRDDLAAHLRAGRGDLRRRSTADPSPGAGRRGPVGTVTLVGGGPGDIELLTLRGRRALAEADVVVTDRLGPTGVLAELRPGVEVIDVGKAPGNHPVPQGEINRILVERAQRGQAVVRLKGGDPFVFGRGGEEIIACREAGVPVTVVPGVSSALAVPLAAGIPLTHRGMSTAFHVITGHGGLDEAARVALRERSGTVVVLMGVSMLGEIVRQALESGVVPTTPVAVVENGTLDSQRVTRAPLGEIAAAVAQADVRAPAVIVLGDVAAVDLLEPPSAAVGGTCAE